MAEYDINDLGFTSLLDRRGGSSATAPKTVTSLSANPGEGTYNGGFTNDTINTVVDSSAIGSGHMSAVLYSGKPTFDSTAAGYRMGVDTDGIFKWVIGDGTNSVDWAVTTAATLTVKGTITATSGTITGGLVIGTGGNIHSGQTAYATGTGYWLEYNAGTPRFSLGNPAGQFLTWDGSALTITGGTLTATLFAGSITGSTSTMSVFTTTGSNNTTRVSISNASYGTPAQVANSLAVIVGSTKIFELRPTLGSIGNFIMAFTPAASDGQGAITYSTGDTGDTTADATFGTVKLAATSASGKISLLSLQQSGDARSLIIAHAKTTYAPIIITNTGVVSTNFHKLISGTTMTIWESNGTTPNGNLSGTAGDICYNADSGKQYHCTGTTNWTVS